VGNDCKKRSGLVGHDASRKHNLIVMLRLYDMSEVMRAIGELKPEIESAEPGLGVTD